MLGVRGTLFALAILIVSIAAALADPGGPAAMAAAPRSSAIAPSARVDVSWISAVAERVSGRRLVVTCATSAREWAATVEGVGFRSAVAEEYYGLSLINSGEMHLSPYVCEGLRLGTSATTRRANELQVGWAVDVLIHESIHMGRFTVDEALTEACAKIALPAQLHGIYGIPYRSAELARLTMAATWFRRTQGPAYRGGTCPEADGASDRVLERAPTGL